MRGMNSEFVDLIATDPPFNKGRDFHATPDSLAAGASFQDRSRRTSGLGRPAYGRLPSFNGGDESAQHAHSDGHWEPICVSWLSGCWKCAVCLKTQGVLHCDPTASHYLKAVMDAIFGRKQFRNEIVWCYLTGGRSKRHVSTTLFCGIQNPENINSITMMLVFLEISAPRAGEDEDGRMYQQNIKHGKEYKYYVDKGVLNSYWTDIAAINPSAKERATALKSHCLYMNAS